MPSSVTPKSARPVLVAHTRCDVRVRVPILLSVAAIGASTALAGEAGGLRVAGPSTAPAVPLSVQRAIARRAPEHAFVATVLPIGRNGNITGKYGYYRWTYSTRFGLVIYFRWPDNPPRNILFAVDKQTRPWSTAAQSAVRLDGTTLYGVGDYPNTKSIWRCVRGRYGTLMSITATGPYDVVSGADLERMVVSAQPVR